MNSISRRVSLPLMAASALCAFTAGASAQETPADPDARAAATVARMSLDEKLSLMQTELLVRIPPKDRPKDIAAGVGYTPGVPRLGVPLLTESDASLGVANMGGFMRPNDVATALPSALAMGATWNMGLVEQGGRMMGGEARAKGFNVLLAGGVNLIREPRNGRNFEYFSEDPLLSGTLAGASIRGVQSNQIVSTIKHYVLNAQETGRSFLNVRIDEAAMRESDLLAFQIANEIGQPGAFMCAYNQVNGAYSCENTFLLDTVLRRDWGFKGWVMSDWNGVHSVSLGEGLDQESGVTKRKDMYFGQRLRDALASGKIDPSLVDRAATRIVRTMYRLGLDARPVTVGQPIDFAANAKVAQNLAEQGIVLLKNEGNILPLASQVARILVIGSHADVGVTSGGGSSQVWPVGGASLSLPIPGDVVYHRQLYMPSSPLLALREQFPQAQVLYDDGTDPKRAAAAAKNADIAIVFAEQFMAEGRDSLDLRLPQGQDTLIEQVAVANPKTVVVLETGGPVLMPWIDRVPAVLEAWYGGQRGGHAIARVLSGAVNPSGRLPVSFPNSLDQLPNPKLPGSDRIKFKPGSDLYDMPAETKPLNVTYPEGADAGYRWFARQDRKPLFALGHGLSYTTFSQSTPRIKGMIGRAQVRNTGPRSGASVAQLYLVSRAGKPERRLVGYQRIELEAGGRKEAIIAIDARMLADWRDGSWSMPKGEYRFALGSDALTLGREVSVRYATRTWTDKPSVSR